VVDQLPSEPETEKLRSAIDLILEHHSPQVVAIYLRLFLMMDDAGWTRLAEILGTDERLRLG
jgi:hypothetical protein